MTVSVFGRGRGAALTAFVMTAAIVGVVVIAFGCSSIPDVVFSDDAGTAATSSSSGSTSSSSGDAAPNGDAEVNVDDFDCPDKPPPPNMGVCCGNELCLRCTQFHCDRCDRENCDSPEVCCLRGNGVGNMDCRRRSSCLAN